LQQYTAGLLRGRRPACAWVASPFARERERVRVCLGLTACAASKPLTSILSPCSREVVTETTRLTPPFDDYLPILHHRLGLQFHCHSSLCACSRRLLSR